MKPQADVQFEPVIGLEIHVQLQTERKIFATESFAFGGSPNQPLSAITYAHPGALPSLNETCIRHAVRLGQALGCQIDQHCHFDRKNYFYPDLPKGYQMSQDQRPICVGGTVPVLMSDGSLQTVALHHIHLEEDAGKSQHDQLPGASVIDLNRAGVGLVEMVTLPVIGNAELAGATVAAVRRLVRCLEVSDGHMEQGSLRCDANVSIKPVGQEQLGTRVEIKNINSISHVIRAIQYEIKRQEALIRSGGSVVQETRTWHMERLETQAMREKETADDYRYFPEPDLLPIQLSDEMLAESAGRLPVLPHVCFEQYHQQLGLSLNEAFALVDDPAYNRYFEAWRAISATPKAAAHWLLGPVRAWLNETQSELDSFSLQPEQLEQIVALIQTGTISHGAAKQQLFPAMLEQPDVDPGVLAESLGLVLKSQVAEVEAAMTRVMEQFPDKVASYQKGKKGLKGFFVGQVMRAFKGQADPKEVNTIVQRLLG